jgi:hypothetical protein
MLFRNRGNFVERILLDTTIDGSGDRFINVVDKYPPIYLSDLIADDNDTVIVGHTNNVCEAQNCAEISPIFVLKPVVCVDLKPT